MPEAVGAEQVDVVHAGDLEIDVHLDGVLHAQGPRDDVLVGEVLDLLLRERPHLEVVVQEGVVLGELLDAVLANAIDAAVADVREVRAFADEEHAGDGGAHALVARVALGLLEDLQVGQLDPGDQAVGLVVARAVHLVRPGGLGILAGALEEVANDGDGELAGDLAGSVAAHAVGDDVEVLVLHDGERILVLRALHAHVGLPGHLDGNLDGRQRDEPSCFPCWKRRESSIGVFGLSTRRSAARPAWAAGGACYSRRPCGT
jgi:hypothetical protein